VVLFIHRDKKSCMNSMQTQPPTRHIQFGDITLQYDTCTDTQLRIRYASHVCGFAEGVRAKSSKLSSPSPEWFIAYCSRFPFVSFYIAFFKVLLLLPFNARPILIFSFSSSLFVTILFLEGCMFYQLLPV
jgi:hypothetical protein